MATLTLPPTSDLVIPTLDTCTRQTDQLFCTTKANVRSRVNRICPALLRISLTEEMADDFRIASCISRSSSVSKPNYCSVQHMPGTPCLSAYRCLIGTASLYLAETRWCIGGVYAGIRRIPTPGFFGQRILTSVIINKQGTFRPFATPLCVYP